MRAAYFLGGIVTGIIGTIAALWAKNLVNERDSHEELLREAYSSKKDAAEPEAEEEAVSEESSADATQTQTS